MQGRVAQLSLAAVALLVGMLLVGQLRSQARPIELGSLSPQDLSTLIDTLSASNAELRNTLADLREQVRTYEAAQGRGQSSLDVTREELRRIKAFGGLAPVVGQGVLLRIDGALDPTAVNDLVHELRNAGAEAIAVDDIRITARSVAVLGAGSIEIDGRPIGSAFRILAIGSPDGLFSAMERPGGITAQLEQSVRATIVVEEREQLRVPGTERDLAPIVAQPIE